MIKFTLTMLSFLLTFCAANATPLYLQLIEKAKPDKEAMDAAAKQIKEHQEIKIKRNLFVSPFHKTDSMPTKERRAVCDLCHLPLPHQKNIRSRTFLNMHSQYVACETCHMRPANYPLSYRWVNFYEVEKKQALTEKGSQKPVQNAKIDSIRKLQGQRITPFYQGQIAIIFAQHPYSRKLKKIWSIAGDKEKIKLKARLHYFLEKKGPECIRCHRKKEPFLNLKSLSATDRQIRAIEENVIAKFFARFKKDDDKLRITNILR